MGDSSELMDSAWSDSSSASIPFDARFPEVTTKIKHIQQPRTTNTSDEGGMNIDCSLSIAKYPLCVVFFGSDGDRGGGGFG